MLIPNDDESSLVKNICFHLVCSSVLFKLGCASRSVCKTFVPKNLVEGERFRERIPAMPFNAVIKSCVWDERKEPAMKNFSLRNRRHSESHH